MRHSTNNTRRALLQASAASVAGVASVALGLPPAFAQTKTTRLIIGFPAGGQFDTRFAWYVGDSWKASKRLTITYGVHYVRDTGRSDSDLAAIPALNKFGAGLGNKVHQPNKNFSPPKFNDI